MESIDYEPDSYWLLYNTVNDVEIPLRKGKIEIGSDNSNMLCIPTELVSNMHAMIEISPDDTKITITNLENSKGTYINGEKVAHQRALDVKFGDNICFGIEKENFDLPICPTYVARRRRRYTNEPNPWKRKQPYYAFPPYSKVVLPKKPKLENKV